MRVFMHAPGPPGHGVVRHACVVARLVARSGADVVRPSSQADVVHAQFTDALWGPSIGEASAAFRTWARFVAAPLVVTAHDLPGFDADPGRDARRAAGYRSVLDRADAVVVAYEHEAAAVRSLTTRPVAVIELPLDPVTPPLTPAPDPDVAPLVGVLGFVYPGKGHLAVLRATAAAGLGRVAHLGAASPGHEDLRDELERLGAKIGVEVETTGTLTDDALARAIRRVTVPVWAAAGASASGSLVTWIAHGRRPVAVERPLTVEMAERHPGSLTLVAESDLGDAIRRAAAAPSTTVLAGPPAWSATGPLHVALYASVAGR